MKTIVITLMPDTYDHDEVRWQDDITGKQTGFGFRSREGDKTIGMQRCPECELENYAMTVASGICYKCGFNANQRSKG